ncbi:hypothetical protein MD484_g9122, partial [Candolleomyces efflorescens]
MIEREKREKSAAAPRDPPALPASSSKASKTTSIVVKTTKTGGQQSTSLKVTKQRPRPHLPHPDLVTLPTGQATLIAIPPYTPVDELKANKNEDLWCKLLMDAVLVAGKLSKSGTVPKHTVWTTVPGSLEKAGLCLVDWPVECAIPGEYDLLNDGPAVGIREIGQPGKKKLIECLTARDVKTPKLVKGRSEDMMAKLMPIVIQAAPIWTPSQVQLFKQLGGKHPPPDSDDFIPPVRGRRLFANGATDFLGPHYVVSTTRPDYPPLFDYSDDNVTASSRDPTPAIPIDPALESEESSDTSAIPSSRTHDGGNDNDDDNDDEDDIEVTPIPAELLVMGAGRAHPPGLRVRVTWVRVRVRAL